MALTSMILNAVSNSDLLVHKDWILRVQGLTIMVSHMDEVKMMDVWQNICEYNMCGTENWPLHY